MIEANIIHAAYLNKVTKIIFLGSSCLYSKMSPQPLKGEYFLSECKILIKLKRQTRLNWFYVNFGEITSLVTSKRNRI